MLLVKHKAHVLTAIIFASLLTHAVFAAEDAPPAPQTGETETTASGTPPIVEETETTAPEPLTRNWISEALSSEKPDDYYYNLLNDGTPRELEDLIETQAHQTPPVERPAVLEAKYQERLATLMGPLTLTQEQRDRIKFELDKAKLELLDVNNAGYYRLLEHEAHQLIKERAPELFGLFQGKSIKSTLRIMAQFLLSLTQGKKYEEALNDARNPDLADQSVRASEQELPIAKALGNILFAGLNDADKRVLKASVQANPPIDPTNLEDLYLEGILKEYIHVLLCRRAGRECEPKKRNGEKKPDDAKDKDGEDKKPAPSPEGPDKTILETVNKANEKLQNALYSLKKAKQLVGGLKGPDRATVKGNIQRALSSNDTLKAAAEAIAARYGQNMPAQYAKMVQTVQEIYKEAGGF